MIVELVLLINGDDPYSPPYSTIVSDIDALVGFHVDSGVSFIEPSCREIGWEAKDLATVDFIQHTIQSVMDNHSVEATVKVRTSVDMLESDIWKQV